MSSFFSKTCSYSDIRPAYALPKKSFSIPERLAWKYFSGERSKCCRALCQLAHSHIPPYLEKKAVFGKEIGAGIRGIRSQKIGAGNLHDTDVIPINGEQSFTKRKKRHVREAVVFQDNAKFFLFKKPGYSLAYGNFTSQVFRPKCFPCNIQRGQGY